jgi:hypothetical protein
MMQKQRVFGVFYHDYVNEVAVNSTQPQSLLANRIPDLARRLLVAEDNFLGVVDRNEVILQLFLDGDAVTVELLKPDVAGCLRSRMPLAACLELLGRLPEAFGVELLPGAEWVD